MFSRKKKEQPEESQKTAKNNGHTDIRSVSKARAWVKSFSVTDMGGTTRRLFVGLTRFNQEPVSPQSRVDITEVILPYVKMVLENLDRHFLTHSFPLPERSQKLFDLKNALLMEVAGSYQLAALEMLTKNSLSKKKLLLSIGRALHYMSRVLVNEYEIYAKNRKTIWHDMHHLYLLACENGLEKKKFSAIENTDKNCLCIEDQYKLVNLIALALPNTLRQGEVFKVRSFFRENIQDVSIVTDSSQISSKYVHVALLNSDEPATLMPTSDLVSSPTSRVFDLSIVTSKLDQFVSLTEDSELGTHKQWPMLTHSLAKRLIYAQTCIQNRRYKRSERDEKTVIAIKMSDVVELIRDNDADSFADQIDEEIEDDNIYEALAAEGDGFSSPWIDLDIDDLAKNRNVNLQTWHIENSSSGGYGLRQIEKSTSTARVGELVAIKDPKDEREYWQVATIRWMDFFKDVGLCIGLEVLSSYAMSVQVDVISNRKLTQKLPIEGVFLPTIEGARDESNLIFPSYIFHIDDELSLTLGSRQQKVRITSVSDVVGSFSYCRFDNIEENIAVEDSLDSYDDVWEFL